MKRRLTDVRNEEAAAQQRRMRDWFLHQAEQAEIVDKEYASDLWNKVLQPVIQQELEVFQSKVWDPQLSGAEYEKLRDTAIKLQQLQGYVESLRGGRQELLRKAQEIQRQLEAHEKEGTIDKEARVETG